MDRIPTTEATLTITPDLALSMAGKAAWVVHMAPITFVVTTSARVASGIVSKWPCQPTPALLTKMSTRPKAVSAARTKARASPGRPTSAVRTRTSAAPASRQRRATDRSGSARRAQSARRAWRRAKARAVASPRPLEAPVIRIAAPRNRAMPTYLRQTGTRCTVGQRHEIVLSRAASGSSPGTYAPSCRPFPRALRRIRCHDRFAGSTIESRSSRVLRLRSTWDRDPEVEADDPLWRRTAGRAIPLQRMGHAPPNRVLRGARSSYVGSARARRSWDGQGCAGRPRGEGGVLPGGRRRRCAPDRAIAFHQPRRPLHPGAPPGRAVGATVAAASASRAAGRGLGGGRGAPGADRDGPGPGPGPRERAAHASSLCSRSPGRRGPTAGRVDLRHVAGAPPSAATPTRGALTRLWSRPRVQPSWRSPPAPGRCRDRLRADGLSEDPPHGRIRVPINAAGCARCRRPPRAPRWPIGGVLLWRGRRLRSTLPDRFPSRMASPEGDAGNSPTAARVCVGLPTVA